MLLFLSTDIKFDDAKKSTLPIPERNNFVTLKTHI